MATDVTPKRIQGSKPILFSGPMVKSILDGTETQTWRVVKIGEPFGKYPIIDMDGPHEGFRDETNVTPTWNADHQTEHAICVSQGIKCPYGQPGDRLWVKETYGVSWGSGALVDPTLNYKSDGRQFHILPGSELFEKWNECFLRPRKKPWNPDHWRSGRFMPRWSSRITLEVTDVRVERVQSISPADCKAEGIKKGFTEVGSHLKDNFRTLWNSINAKRGFDWKSDPFVWVIGFKLLELANREE